MGQQRVAQLVRDLRLEPHPEGGYFRETYRAAETIPHAALPKRFSGERAYATAIYFLLPAGKFSALHRIQADEVWHFYLGGPLTVVQIAPNGKVERTVLGPDLANGHTLQHVVPAGHWFGAYPNTGSAFALVGCTVAPGFDFADFQMGARTELLRQFPQEKEVITRLTHP